MNAKLSLFASTLIAIGLTLLLPSSALAHCDSLDGPVVKDARIALDKGDLTPVLKWIGKEHEAELGGTFKETLAVHTRGETARRLADRYFFGTLVRLHRAGEGAPYTGLKPAGTDPGPAVKAADAALEHGALNGLDTRIGAHAAKAIHERFARARSKLARADNSVGAGREFVAAYVDYVHFVEGLHGVIAGGHGHHAKPTVDEDHGEH